MSTYKHFGMLKISGTLESSGRSPAIVLLGDFNSLPEKKQYEPLAYREIKKHKFNFRSVMNDDVSPR